MATDDLASLRIAALHGVGVTMLAREFVDDDLRDGRLRHLLRTSRRRPGSCTRSSPRGAAWCRLSAICSCLVQGYERLNLTPSRRLPIWDQRPANVDQCIADWQYSDMAISLEERLKALASEKRLQILAWLKDPTAHFRPQIDGDLVKDGVCGQLITEKLGVSQPTASEHLRVLSDAGFSHWKEDQAMGFLQAR